MKNSKLRVAIIGTGMISDVAHIPAYKSMPGLVDLVAVCGHTTFSAEDAAKRHGIPHWYTSAEEMFLKEKPDLISVCTPNMSHKPMTMLALKYGCNVVCEKPVALTYTDTKEMFDYAKSVGKVLVACQTFRYNDEYQFAREQFDNGVLGDVYYSEFSMIRRRGVPKWGSFHKKTENGGGAFCDLGVHLVDAALWVMGGKKFSSIIGTSQDYLSKHETDIVSNLVESGSPSSVRNARAYSPSEFDVEEFAAGSIRLEGGGLINFKTSWAVNLPDEYSMHFAGTKAGLALPQMELYSTMVRYQADIKPRYFPDQTYAGKTFKGHYYLLENVVRHILWGNALLVQPEQTLNVAAVIDAFYRSCDEKREVLAQEITG